MSGVAPAGGGGCSAAVPWLTRPGRLRGNMGRPSAKGRDMEVKSAGYDRGFPRRDELGLGVVCAMTMGWESSGLYRVYLVIWRGGLTSQQRCGVNWRQPVPLSCSSVSISAWPLPLNQGPRRHAKTSVGYPRTTEQEKACVIADETPRPRALVPRQYASCFVITGDIRRRLRRGCPVIGTERTRRHQGSSPC